MASKEKLLESAQKFIAKGQIAKAIGDYQKLVDAFPRDFRFRQKLAELLTRERRHEDAQPHYDAVAKNFTETGFYLKAIAIYKQMQKVEPNRADLYMCLAELNEKQGLIGNALTEYRSLIALLEKNKQLRETLPVLQKMAVLDKENLGIRGKLIETLVACHEDEAALVQFHSLVTFLEEKGESGKIVKLYDKFQELCAASSKDQLPLARALVAGELADKALPLLKDLLKSDPDDADVLGALIDCHLALGNHEDARLTCQHLLKNHPDNLLLRERHVRICLVANDPNRARISLEESRDEFQRAGQMTLFNGLLAEVGGGAPDHLPPPEPATVAEPLPEPPSPASVVTPVASAAAPEVVVPPGVTEIPPRSVAATTPPTVADGLELELDLDLDLSPGASGSTAPLVPPPAAAPVPEPVAVPEVSTTSDLGTETPPSSELPRELELELEFDLGGFEVETIALQEPPPTPASTVVQAGEELELEIGFGEMVVPVTVEGAPAASDELELEPGVDGLEFELELPPVTEFEPPSAAEPEPELTVASEDGSGFAGEGEIELPDETAETLPEELPLPGLDDLELVMETDQATDAKGGGESPAEPEAQPETFSVDEPEGLGAAAGEVYPEEEVLSEEESFEVAALPEESALFDDREELPAEPVVPVGYGAEPRIPAAPAEPDELEELDEVLEELEEIEEIEELEEEEVAEVAAEQDEPLPLETVPAAPSSQLLEGLEDVDFYLRSGLLDDAERVVRELLNGFVDHPELLARLAEIEKLRQEPVAMAEPSAEFSSFAEIREDELLGGVEFTETEAPAVDEFSLEAPIASVEEEGEDLQSHFDLGIAYKEMGLLDDAVAEFDRAGRDPARRLDCLTLKGQCQLEMGQADAAEATYRRALEIPLLSEEGRLVLCYELGLLYEILGRKQEALDNYQVVANIDLFFRDVTDKLRVLRQELGIDDQAIEAVSEGGGGRDRISFV